MRIALQSVKSQGKVMDFFCSGESLKGQSMEKGFDFYTKIWTCKNPVRVWNPLQPTCSFDWIFRSCELKASTVKC